MLKCSNSDTLAFVCLTNGTVQAFVDSLPSNVEEITFWNYKMCLEPQWLHDKEVLFIPSLERFTQLKCVKFYGERIEVETTIFPPNVERVFFISCLVKNQAMNVCVFRKNLPHLQKYASTATHLRPVVGFLPPVSSFRPPTTTSSCSTTNTNRRRTRQRPSRRTKSLWKILTAGWNFGWRFSSSSSSACRISPETHGEIEMTDMVSFPCQRVALPRTAVLHELESIQRFKKTYDLLVNENIIYFLIGDE